MMVFRMFQQEYISVFLNVVPRCPRCSVEFLCQLLFVLSEVFYTGNGADHIEFHADEGDDDGEGVLDCVVAVEHLKEVVC